MRLAAQRWKTLLLEEEGIDIDDPWADIDSGIFDLDTCEHGEVCFCAVDDLADRPRHHG